MYFEMLHFYTGLGHIGGGGVVMRTLTGVDKNTKLFTLKYVRICESAIFRQRKPRGY